VDYDLIVRGATLPGSADALDVAVESGAIAALAPGGALTGSAETELDAGGLHLLPGGIDPHVHFNEPGLTSWEGFLTGSTALATGGLTSFVDMPLNSVPATVDGEAFDAKLACARRHSLLDFGFWGGLVPGKLGRMEELSERGVIGFKAFMCETGTDDFRPADDATLAEGMRRAAALDSIVAVHAESETITSILTAAAHARGGLSVQDYLASRPPAAELEAIDRAIALAADAGCRLHVVHVSTAEGIELVRDARSRGLDVSWETTSHYLTLTAGDVERLGAVAKCSPVMRDEANRERLWHYVAGDPRAIVVSDHSPSPWSEKQGEDFFAAWGGVSGCQSTLGILLEAAEAGRVGLGAAIAAVTRNPADRFRLGSKGAIEVGRDADLVLVDLGARWTLEADELRYRHRHSPFVGLPMRGEVKHAFSRGRAVVRDGDIVGDQRGRLLTPERG
jgi:allantoinase